MNISSIVNFFDPQTWEEHPDLPYKIGIGCCVAGIGLCIFQLYRERNQGSNNTTSTPNRFFSFFSKEKPLFTNKKAHLHAFSMGFDNFAHMPDNYKRFTKQISPEVWNRKSNPFTFSIWQINNFIDHTLELFKGSLASASREFGTDRAKIINKVTNPIGDNYNFSQQSYFSFYHITRRRAFINEEGKLQSSLLTEEQEKPFFTEGTDEYKMRMRFNKLIKKLEKKGVIEYFDQDYQKWLKPDNEYIGPKLQEKDIYILPGVQ